jgi:hypothetical protein
MEIPSNRLGMMQEGGGKLSRKSNKIAKTLMQGSLAVVTPSTKISKREQAQAKKIKQGKKKGLAEFFGQGPRVPASSREGTPINAVVQQRENRITDCKVENKLHLTKLVSLNVSTKVNATKKIRTEGGGERGKEDRQTMGKKNTKKSTRKGSDDENSRRSKQTKSDDKVSAIGGEQPDGVVVILEAMKRSLRKKGASMAKPKGPEKKDRKTATFAEAAGKGAA